MDNYKYNQFCELISTFERLKPKKEVVSREELLKQFTNLTNDLGILKGKVYPIRKEETNHIIEANKHKIQFSTFEVMEHNFRENTHSKVLKYLFHHKFIEDGEGSKILSEFIDKTTKDKELSKLILNNTYQIFQEHVIEEGRIDLLIRDDNSNKPFLIIIENKINANLGKKGKSKKGEITKTQLDIYKKFAEDKFSNYKHCFILLSYKPVEKNVNLCGFTFTNYDGLTEILNKTKSDDNILKEYKKLLYSIKKLRNNTRESLIDLMYSLDDKEMKCLIKLQQINKNFEYEK